MNPTVEEEVLVQSMLPLCISLNHIFANVSPQTALRCSTETFLPNGKLNLTFLKLTFPSYCSPACYP